MIALASDALSGHLPKALFSRAMTSVDTEGA